MITPQVTPTAQPAGLRPAPLRATGRESGDQQQLGAQHGARSRCRPDGSGCKGSPHAKHDASAAPSLPRGGLTSCAASREAGRARPIRQSPPASPRVGLRPRRVRRAGELHARRRDPGAGCRRPASRPESPCSTCAAGSPGRGGSSPASWVAPTWGWTSAPAPSTSRVSEPAAFLVASRSRGSPRSRRGHSMWCCCSRRCSRSPTSSRCCRRSPGRSTSGGRFAFTIEEGPPLTRVRARADARRGHGLAHPA